MKLIAIISIIFASIWLAEAATATRGERIELAVGIPTPAYVERCGFIASPTGHYTPWVIEHLTAASFVRKSDRSDFTFHADDDTPSEFRATLRDYEGSDYDRGHMAPAADMVSDPMAMRDCYRLSNMMPQTKDLNRGPWKALEEHVRELASADGVEAWVVTGPAFLPQGNGALMRDGTSAEYQMAPFSVLGQGRMSISGSWKERRFVDVGGRIWVPTHCWKAVLLKKGKSFQALAWLIPNTGDPPAFNQCHASVDEIEAAAGLDLFSRLPDELEDELEARAN